MFKSAYSFLNFTPTTYAGRVADYTLRGIVAVADLVISVATLAVALAALCGLCICAYYAVGQPTELAGAVAYLGRLANFFPI